MARDTFLIGPAPSDEPCAQLGHTEDFNRVARVEIMTYRAAIIASYGSPPEGASLGIKAHAHDFGTYYDLAVAFDPEYERALWYATDVEIGLSRWGDVGFSGPFVYGERGQILGTAYPDASSVIRAAIVTLEQRVAAHCETSVEARALANLRTAFPDEAAATQAQASAATANGA